MEFLKASQKPHTQILLDVLEKSLFACDFSVMGAGKTYVANAIAVETGLPLFVLAPRGSLDTWERIGDMMDKELGRPPCTNVIFTHTYESLRSVKNCQPKHGYLKRYDFDDGTDFSPTQALKDLVAKGVIIVLDECQKIKNNSDQTKAVRSLIREILHNGGKSRVLFLSGTPFEKTEQAVNFFRTMGFINHRELYTTDKEDQVILRGLSELIENLEAFQPEETEQVLLPYLPFTKKSIREDAKKLVFDAFTEIIVPYFSSAMPSPAISYKKDVGNGYYVFKGPNSKSESLELSEAISQLQSAAAFDSEIRRDVSKLDFGAITLALKRIEVAKIALFARAAQEELDKGKKNKVIIFVNYRETIDRLCQLLDKYKPLVYDGRLTGRQQETDVIDSFNLNGSRLLIANLKKGGISISLHDTIGDEPRTSLISPTYSILDMHQASARTYRQDLKSDVKIRVVYGEVAQIEMKILKALSRKTENMKRILKVQAAEGVLFPGEYPEFHDL